MTNILNFKRVETVTLLMYRLYLFCCKTPIPAPVKMDIHLALRELRFWNLSRGATWRRVGSVSSGPSVTSSTWKAVSASSVFLIGRGVRDGVVGVQRARSPAVVFGLLL